MILLIILWLTLIVPVAYWAVTGNDWVDLSEDILWLGENGFKQ